MERESSGSCLYHVSWRGWVTFLNDRLLSPNRSPHSSTHSLHMHAYSLLLICLSSASAKRTTSLLLQDLYQCVKKKKKKKAPLLRQASFEPRLISSNSMRPHSCTCQCTEEEMRGTLEHISANTKCSAALLLKQMGRGSSSRFGNFNITSLILGDAFHLPFLSSCTLPFLKYCSMLGNNVTNVHILTPRVHAYYCTICHIIAILPSFQKIKKAKLKPSFYSP